MTPPEQQQRLAQRINLILYCFNPIIKYLCKVVASMEMYYLCPRNTVLTFNCILIFFFNKLLYYIIEQIKLFFDFNKLNF